MERPSNNYTDQMSVNPRHQTLIRTWTRHRVWFLLSAMLVCQARGYSQLGPQPPCGKEPVPPYPGLDDSAIVKSWSKSEFGRDWKPPACTGWAAMGFTTLVTTVARFHQTSGAEGSLRHIGAISKLAGMRYWSTTHKRWQTLIVDAYALTGSQPSQRREDFAPEEMKEGKVLYYVQVDNLSGKATYRMHIVEASADRLVFDVENVSTMHYLFITLILLLKLESPNCVDEDKAQPDLNPSRKNVRKVQLVLNKEHDERANALRGKRVVATGTLFGAHTGHHHTSVLLTVTYLDLPHWK